MKDFLLRFVCLLVAASAAAGQDTFRIEWSTIDSGGSPPPGTGEFTVAGSIGHFDTGSATGEPPGEFDITGGYWTFDLETPLDLGLKMQLDGGTVTLTWDGSTDIPVVLESSVDLQLWEPVSPQPSAPLFLEPAGTRRYYRLTRAPVTPAEP